MDPLTQGVVGAVVPQSAQINKKRRYLVLAGLFGMIGGMVPDLDVLIQSDHDPLLYLEFHRQFTHALVFIPVGGFLCALVLHFGLRRFHPLTFLQTYLFCTMGYATHGLLDAATSYGTQLLWPFSNMRVAFNIISIIDPLFTVPLVVLSLIAAIKGRVGYARAALLWGAVYMSLAAYQSFKAREMGREIAQARGHEAIELSAKPSFGNILVWKVIYRDADRYYVDAVRVGYKPKVFEGTSIAALDIKRDFPWLDLTSQQARDIERFRWFSDGALALAPDHPNRIIDLRYSFLPNQIDGLWSIELSPERGENDHADFVTHRKAGAAQRRKLWQMITE